MSIVTNFLTAVTGGVKDLHTHHPIILAVLMLVLVMCALIACGVITSRWQDPDDSDDQGWL